MTLLSIWRGKPRSSHEPERINLASKVVSEVVKVASKAVADRSLASRASSSQF